ncbi:hypothetical protein EON67_06415 [archaeon]|nr:MAG: hypothetical protein EON67_06415 [archaeon]
MLHSPTDCAAPRQGACTWPLCAGCQVFGDENSPVIPMMLYNPTKIAAFSRECLKRGVRSCVQARARAHVCTLAAVRISITLHTV